MADGRRELLAQDGLGLVGGSVPFAILPDFAFLLLDGGSRRWTTDNIADTMPGEGVVRHNISDYGVLRERAVLVNFYFDDVPWSTHIPVTEMKIN